MATVIDLLAVFLLYSVGDYPRPFATSMGAVFGSIFTFFVNRHFAFRDHKPEVAPQAIKFVLTTAGAVLVHAGLVWLLSVRHDVNLYVAKLVSDVAVFSVGQLFLLRYVVFPKAKPEDLRVAEPTLPVG